MPDPRPTFGCIWDCQNETLLNLALFSSELLWVICMVSGDVVVVRVISRIYVACVLDRNERKRGERKNP
jgi:hypothetical protein